MNAVKSSNAGGNIANMLNQNTHSNNVSSIYHSLWNSPALNHLIDDTGHVFSKVWLIIHIISIFAIILSFMVRAKGNASDKEDWFAKGQSMGKWIYMFVVGFDIVVVFFLFFGQLKLSTILIMLIAIGLFVGYQFVIDDSR